MPRPHAEHHRARLALALAAAAGTIHGAFSCYWGLGGSWMLNTLGARLVTTFATMRWGLVPLGVVKVACAVAPLALDLRGWLVSRPVRGVCWLASAVLVLWGGVNSAVGNLVMGGVIRPAGGYDRPGMMGHAWLWDPLFLLWGMALATALLQSPASPFGVLRRRHLPAG